MKRKYDLDAGEILLYEVENVSRHYKDGRRNISKTGTFVLTSERILWLEFGMFGSVKNEETYYVGTDIANYLGHPRLDVTDSFFSQFSVEIIFRNRKEEFVIPDKVKGRKIVEEIKKIFSYYNQPDPDFERVENGNSNGRYSYLPGTARTPTETLGDIGNGLMAAVGLAKTATTDPQSINRMIAKVGQSITDKTREYSDSLTARARLVTPPMDTPKPMQMPVEKTKTVFKKPVTIKCPCCTAPIHARTGETVRCEYCDSYVEIE